MNEARKAKDYSEKLKNAVKRISLLTAAERLRLVQDHIEQLPHRMRDFRGKNPDLSISKIRLEIGRAISSLQREGPGSIARKYLAEAQEELNQYEDSADRVAAKTPDYNFDADAKRNMRLAVQEAVSELVSATNKLEE